MKKASKLLSALLLLGQVVGYAPVVLADKQLQSVSTEQQTVKKDTDTTTSDNMANTKPPEVAPNDTESENNSNPVSGTNDSAPDTLIDQNQMGNSEKEEPADSSTQDSVSQEEAKLSETNQNKNTSTSTESSYAQEETNSGTSEATNTYKPQDASSTTSQTVSTTPKQVTKETQDKLKGYDQVSNTPNEKSVSFSEQDSNEVIHFEKNESVESFIRKIGESARKVGQENDLYASVMIAQAILESASGQSELAQAPNYNLFGIKGIYNGKSVSFTTQEDLGNGNYYTIKADFRQYENYEDCLNDYVELIKEGLPSNSSFYNGVWKTNAKTYQDATKFLKGRYATDSQYDQKLNGLIETYELTKYDQEVVGPELSQRGYSVPLKNYTISSPFGNRDGEFHRGIDFAAAQGEPIYASQAGTVIRAEYHPSWGNYVAIQHEDGTTALYAHQQEYQVKVNDQVKQGQIIGYVGSTGNSTGSHLHFEFCLDNSLSQSQLIDPKRVLF
ncbi:peptidoglycan DD-metalloendopeptidase family protein [Enterococcus casseliflavus]|uniref:peptidoglycan DD-metalloendopeptidase family protein n=1 Tax=Enterococcus casseliflavus TaxID=37734 RepID=UPI002DBC23C9|nr:peptidoglycan DD-metalloendopeptidase family protein [Enterococcus casseliflavus]MEB8418518.1 peptidoglycan DD-metalloendopeptidase family protein [Enterococcus casseliflavus]